MPLTRAVIVGAIGAIAIPWLNHDGELAPWLSRGVVHFSAGSFHLSWSWPIFCIVTLLTWGLLAAANR
jgi:hypothetical protein